MPIHVQNKAQSVCKTKQEISLWSSAVRGQKAVSKGKVQPESFFKIKESTDILASFTNTALSDKTTSIKQN